MNIRPLLLICFAAAAAPQAAAQQSEIGDYQQARDEYFWDLMYDTGGETAYCGAVILKASRTSAVGEALSVEHAYPADWIAESFGCDNRDDCDHPAYGFAEADLHNLWPAFRRINSSRQDLAFGEIQGEDERRFTDICPDFERTAGADAVVEPRDGMKGDLARSMLYMMLAYGLDTRGLGPMLLRWHAADPPDEHEQWRNHTIERLQGNRNPFIDITAAP